AGRGGARRAPAPRVDRRAAAGGDDRRAFPTVRRGGTREPSARVRPHQLGRSPPHGETRRDVRSSYGDTPDSQSGERGRLPLGDRGIVPSVAPRDRCLGPRLLLSERRAPVVRATGGQGGPAAHALRT